MLRGMRSVGLVQRCERHWRIFGHVPYGRPTTFLSDDSMQFLQTPTQAHSLSGCLGIHIGQAIALKSKARSPLYSFYQLHPNQSLSHLSSSHPCEIMFLLSTFSSSITHSLYHIPGSKLPCSTNSSHHRLLLPHSLNWLHRLSDIRSWAPECPNVKN